jgi:hypothetical protein
MNPNMKDDMNVRKLNLIQDPLDFMALPVPDPNGGQRYILLAFSSDGAMWLDPRELGIGPQHAVQLARFGEPYLLVNERVHTVLINARAVVLVKTDSEWGRQWLAFVEDMIQEHQRIRQLARVQYESARNN